MTTQLANITWMAGFFSVLCTTAIAQQPITISLFSEATAIPFTTFINKPLHPGIQVGTELDWKEKARLRLYPGVNIGYMFHRRLFQGLYANVKIGFDLKTNFGLNFKSQFGLGYLRTFTTQQEFQFKNGQYVSKPDKGNSRIMPSLSFGVGYQLKKEDPRSPEIFILYESWIEYPYSPGFIPLMAHTNVHIGSKFFLNKPAR